MEWNQNIKRKLQSPEHSVVMARIFKKGLLGFLGFQITRKKMKEMQDNRQNKSRNGTFIEPQWLNFISHFSVSSFKSHKII